MAIKIIRKPSEVFRIECENCEALIEYSFHDMISFAIKCPCCDTWNDHRCRNKLPKESNNERQTDA